jgi:hypothetical protein
MCDDERKLGSGDFVERVIRELVSDQAWVNFFLGVL